MQHSTSTPVRRRCLTRLAALCALCLLLCAAVGARTALRCTSPSPMPVQSVAQLHADLLRDPEAWVGRTVRVRARAEACPWWGARFRALHCLGQPLVLLDESAVAPLPLRRTLPSPLAAFVRQLPLLGRLVPSSQQLEWGRPAVFRIQLERTATAPPAYEAVLVDGAIAQQLG